MSLPILLSTCSVTPQLSNELFFLLTKTFFIHSLQGNSSYASSLLISMRTSFLLSRLQVEPTSAMMSIFHQVVLRVTFCKCNHFASNAFFLQVKHAKLSLFLKTINSFFGNPSLDGSLTIGAICAEATLTEATCYCTC